MIPVLAFGALATLIAEIWVITRVADHIGGANTLLLLILLSAGGAWMVKRQGMSAWQGLRSTMKDGSIPAAKVVDGALILLAGFLLLPPGFLTGFAGLLLLVPHVRRIVAKFAGDMVKVRVMKRVPSPVRNAAGWANAANSARGATGDRFGGTAGQNPWTRWSRPDSDEVIDVDGEEVDLTQSPPSQLGPGFSVQARSNP